jgi:hypothetical protein
MLLKVYLNMSIHEIVQRGTLKKLVIPYPANVENMVSS